MGHIDQIREEFGLPAGETYSLLDLRVQALSSDYIARIAQAGDAITGFVDLADVDSLTDLCLTATQGLPFREFDSESIRKAEPGLKARRVYEGWGRHMKHADEGLMPKRTRGNIIDIGAVMVTDLRQLVEGPQLDRVNEISYGIFGNLRSGGKGIVGQLVKLVQVRNTLVADGSYTRRMILYSDILGTDAERMATELRHKSAENARRTTRLVSGGLPGLGKRR